MKHPEDGGCVWKMWLFFIHNFKKFKILVNVLLGDWDSCTHICGWMLYTEARLLLSSNSDDYFLVYLEKRKPAAWPLTFSLVCKDSKSRGTVNHSWEV